MKRAAVVSTILVAALAFLSRMGSATPQPLVFEAGPPVLLEGVVSSELAIYSEEQYGKLAERLSKGPRPMKSLIRHKPEGLSPQAGFGINLVIGGQNLSWAVDRDRKGKWVFHPDLNANGDLTDDIPIRFEEEKGEPVLRIRTQARETVDGRQEEYPIEAKLRFQKEPTPGEAASKTVLLKSDTTLRRGVAHLGDREVAFGLLGTVGIYGNFYHQVVFDLDGNGILALAARKSPEVYTVAERYVNLEGKSYEFKVDRYGRSLTLLPLAEKRPDRPVPLPGYPAPEFTATDMEGKTRKLSDYRGKVLLLDFWFANCGPCVAEAPKIAALYRRYNGKGLEVLGVNSGDTAEHVRKFAAEHGATWPQILEARDGGALENLFRVVGRPTYYLIDREGKIVSDTVRPGLDLERQLEMLFQESRETGANSPVPGIAAHAQRVRRAGRRHAFVSLTRSEGFPGALGGLTPKSPSTARSDHLFFGPSEQARQRERTPTPGQAEHP